MVTSIPFALRQSDGRYIEASEVPSGIACGCVCPKCGERLIARHKRRSQRVSHFAHQTQINCESAWETALHKTAKQIVSEIFKISFKLDDSGFRFVYQYDEAHVEKPFADFVPDVITRHESGSPLLIEILVTHEVDEPKREKIRLAKVTCIEIDLSKVRRTITYNELQQKISAGEYSARLVHNELADLQQRLDAAYAFRHPKKFAAMQRQKRSEQEAKAAAQKKQEEWQKRAPWLKP